jgi:ABC-type transporter Mla subunit MlaD
MRHLITTLATAGILLFGMTAAAQYRPLNPENDRQDQLFEHLRADLSTANTAATPLTGDFSRIDRATEALNSLQYQVDRGDYNLRQFDQAIQAVQEVMHQNATLSNRTLDNFSDDLGQLRVLETRSPDWRQ